MMNASMSLLTIPIFLCFNPTVKILQSRGVAFVTYVSELNAQFAKEAMMCQSLDDDEILNVRWATDDPNPVAKVREKRRLVELGEEGIAKKLPVEFVQAIQEMDELEGLENAPSHPSLPARPGTEGGDERASKRFKTIEGTGSSAPPLPTQPPPVQTGLLSQTAIDSLRYIAAVRQQNQAAAPPTGTPSTTTGLGGLADYGSDDEDED